MVATGSSDVRKVNEVSKLPFLGSDSLRGDWIAPWWVHANGTLAGSFRARHDALFDQYLLVKHELSLVHSVRGAYDDKIDGVTGVQRFDRIARPLTFPQGHELPGLGRCCPRHTKDYITVLKAEAAGTVTGTISLAQNRAG